MGGEVRSRNSITRGTHQLLEGYSLAQDTVRTISNTEGGEGGRVCSQAQRAASLFPLLQASSPFPLLPSPPLPPFRRPAPRLVRGGPLAHRPTPPQDAPRSCSPRR